MERYLVVNHCRERTIQNYPLLLFLTGLCCLHSCAYDIDQKGGINGTGNVLKEKRDLLAKVHTIDVSEDLNVFVTQAAIADVTVEADANIMELIGTDTAEGILYIHTHKNIGRATKNIYVSIPKPTKIIVSKGAVVQTTGIIKADSALVSAATGSLIKARFMVNGLTVAGKEGAGLFLSGTATKLKATVTSGSSIDAKKLKVERCHVQAKYGGTLWVQVLDSLAADSNTGAAVYYLGTPAVNQEKSRSGTVQKY